MNSPNSLPRTTDPVADVQAYLAIQNRLYEDTNLHNSYITDLGAVVNLESAMEYIEKVLMTPMQSLALSKREIFKVYLDMLKKSAYGKQLTLLDAAPMPTNIQGNIRGSLCEDGTSNRIFQRDVQLNMSQSIMSFVATPVHYAGAKILELAAMQLVGMFDYEWA